MVILVILFLMLFKVVLTFESVDESFTGGNSNESYGVAYYHAVQDDSDC